MKRFYKISCNADSKPVRLIVSVVLAFVVMLFINGFIGSMGGFPAFIAFVLAFYSLRTVTSAGNRIMHQLAMTSKRETGYLLRDYILKYLILWTVFRIAHFFSRVTGWGNFSGANALEYVRELLETSMLEKWAYFFAGIVMFAFVLSLFPLVVIRKWGQWTLYALVDGACFALLCLGINGICKTMLIHGQRGRGACVIDNLLLCKGMETWQELLFLLLIVLFTAAVGVFVFFYGAKAYGPKPGSVKADVIAQAKQEPGIKRIRQHPVHALLPGICGIAAVIVVAVSIVFMPEDTDGGYTKVAEFLTGDEAMGPMVYEGTVYVPVDEEVNLTETGTPQGYLAGRDEDCDSRFYRMTVANLLYVDAGRENGLVQMKGESEGVYAPAESVEQTDDWKKDTVFLLWDEDWVSESAYSHEPTGYTACNIDLIEGLMMQFPSVTYDVQDFTDYDAYFTIRAYPDMDQVLEEHTGVGHWVGCILVKDNKFYFGSYDNPITGICLQQLREVLGGNF